MENILKDVVEKRNHLSTGNLCTKYMLEKLADEGYADVAYKLVTQTTYPSWGYMIANGATTIWERWEHATGGAMNSHNHPMFATVGSWFYKYLGGINASDQYPGFERFTIRPYVPDGLDFVKSSFKTLRGTIVSNWKREKGDLELEVTVPFNSRADVYIPLTGKSPDNVTVFEGNTVIWSKGAAVGHATGITAIGFSLDSIRLETGSGEYSFKCVLEPK